MIYPGGFRREGSGENGNQRKGRKERIMKKLKPVAPELIIRYDREGVVFAVEWVRLGGRKFKGFSARARTYKEALKEFVEKWKEYCRENFGRFMVLEYENEEEIRQRRTYPPPADGTVNN